MRFIGASFVLAAASAIHINQFDPKKDDESFGKVQTEMDQALRNIDQGILGQQLGLTKIVSLKMHFKDL